MVIVNSGRAADSAPVSARKHLDITAPPRARKRPTPTTAHPRPSRAGRSVIIVTRRARSSAKLTASTSAQRTIAALIEGQPLGRNRGPSVQPATPPDAIENRSIPPSLADLALCRVPPNLVPGCPMTDTLTIRRPDDWQLHLRDGAMPPGGPARDPRAISAARSSCPTSCRPS